MVLAVVAAAALILGFTAGFLTRKRSATWCPDPQCGAQLRCIPCTVRERLEDRQREQQRAVAAPHAADCR